MMSKKVVALTISLLSLALSKQVSKPTVADLKGATSIIEKNGNVPIVNMFGYNYAALLNDWGVNVQFGVDLNLGFDLPVQHLALMGNDNLLVNPQIYAEVASHNFIEIITPVI